VTKPTYLFVKVKIGEGLLWRQSNQVGPNKWFIASLKTGEKQYDFMGKPMAEIVSVTYYPIFQTLLNTEFNDQYNTYLTVKLAVTKNHAGGYNFDRDVLSVASPIALDFPSSQISGTIIEISKNNIKDKLLEKMVVLTKKVSDPIEYNSIAIGESYFDGKTNVFNIVDKSLNNNNINVTAKIKFKQKNDNLIFGEEENFLVNKSFRIITNRSELLDYKVQSIQ
jgi:hypothetical protein